MEWFSVWLPLTSQLVVPVSLLAWMAFGRHTSRARWIARAALVATYVLAIGIAGLWLVLPWWLPFAYGALLAWTVVRPSRRSYLQAPRSPDIFGRAVTALTGALALLLVVVTGVALEGRRPPAEPIDLAFPLRSGTYLVVNGGSQVLVNAHVGTLEGERFARYRGQSYGVDLVRINGVGLRVPGVLPADPAAYLIFGDPVLAPCGGRVVIAEDGAADMPPPQADRAHMVGNHVILECGAVWVILGHLQRGSVVASTGQVVEPGHVLGRVGNSGNTGEPHLHVHVQRPGATTAPLSGDPVPVRLGGRYLVRNDRIPTGREP
jgi:Peptidase family M23